MDRDLALSDAESLADAVDLAAFDVRRRAQKLVADAAVKNLTALGGGAWAAVVHAGRSHEATLTCAAGRWRFACTCAESESPCSHATATALVLLENHRRERRRQLLSGTYVPPPDEPTLREEPDAPPANPLAPYHALFRGLRSPVLSGWDLHALGWPAEIAPQPLWPDVPADFEEFCAGLVLHAADWAVSLPADVLEAARRSPRQEALALWAQEQATERWTRLARDAAPPFPGSFELRPPLVTGADWRLRHRGPALPPPWPAACPVPGWPVPAAVIESALGAAFLEKLAVAVPETVSSRVRAVPWHFTLHGEATASLLDDAPPLALVRFAGATADGARRNDFGEEGWRHFDEVAATDRWTRHDDTAKTRAAAWFGTLGAVFHRPTRQWQLTLTPAAAERVATALKRPPGDVTLELSGELRSLLLPPVAAITRLEVLEDGLDWFELRAVRDVSDTTLTTLEIKALLDAEGAFVHLGKRGWRTLQDQTDPAVRQRIEAAGMKPRGLASEARRFHTLQLARDGLADLLPPQTRERLVHRTHELETLEPPTLPTCITATLRPYQLEGFQFLAALSQAGCGGLLADDMGLGKTLQTLCWLAWLRESAPEGQRSALVVCPKSLTDNWRAEARKFIPGLHVRVWRSRELRLFASEAPWAGLNIVSYPQLRQLAEKLPRVSFLAAILDEAQAIKNPDSATSKAARAIAARHRLALSGTPIENRLLDLWSVMAFAVPGVLGNRVTFEREIECIDDLDGPRRLAQRVRPFVLRRTKMQVAKDLPERIEEDIHCEMSDAQRTLYRAELKKAQQQLLRVDGPQQFQQERFHVLASLMRLRQLCCDPNLVFPGAKLPSAKLEALDDLLEPILAEGHKALIFSQFTSMLHGLHERLRSLGVPICVLTGETDHRGAVVDRFNATHGPALFLISLKAGGAGLNLTSASYVILFDPWWNPAAEAQAIDRAHRIGQQRTVIAYRLLIKDSLEEKIRALQTAKAALAQGVLGEEAFHQSLSLSDLKNLLAE